MKILMLLGAFFLTGCGSMSSLEYLEEQALLTGNWSAVEKRERLIAKRDARRPIQCPSGFVSYCEQQFRQKRCGCVDRAKLFATLAWR